MAAKFSKKLLLEQGIPLALTLVVFAFFTFAVYLLIRLLNLTGAHDIVPRMRPGDVLVGMTIYLKTSVDFAIFIGNLMGAYPGWKNRIAIEIGTAAGNALGTMMILTVWNFFRTVEWLLAIMILLAALVLLRLAEEGLAHAGPGGSSLPSGLRGISALLSRSLRAVNTATAPLLRFIVPEFSLKAGSEKAWGGLFVLSFTIPFILGLDDFAGYVPVFNIVNVFGFSTGVLLGHMVLNILLFISPGRTIRAVKQPVISLFGSAAFTGLALWGIWEVLHIFIR